MDGKTSAYLDLAATPAVGATLLDPRPAFVFASDGSRMRFANAAGLAFFGEASMAALLERTFPGDGTISRQMARLAKSLPGENPRLEMLRFSFGMTQFAVPAECQRLNVADGTRAVLAIVTVGAAKESQRTIAERLADALGTLGSAVAVLTRDGSPIGASGGLADLAAAASDIRGLIEAAATSSTGLARAAIALGDATRGAGVVEFDASGETLYLLVVDPATGASATPPTKPVQPTEVRVVEAPMPEVRASDVRPFPSIVRAPPSPPTITVAPEPKFEPVQAAEATTRFLWQSSAEHRVTFVSPELEAAVGATGAVAGKPWDEILASLALDLEGKVAAALASHASWSGVTVRWPVADSDEGVAVDLSAVPSFSRGRQFGGYRGFGNIRLADRQTVVGSARVTPDPVAIVEPAPPEPAVAATLEPPAVAPEPPPSPHERPPSPPLAFSEEDIDDAARKSIEEGRRSAAPREQKPAEPEEPKRAPAVAPAAPVRSNVVRLPGAPVRAFPPERLSGNEQDAFRRIAEALGVRMPDDRDQRTEDRGQKEASGEARAEARLLDKLPVGIIVYSDRATLFANRALLDLLGYASFADFAAAGGAEAVFPNGAAARPAAGNKGEVSARRRDGSSVPVEARLHGVSWGQASAVMLSLVKRGDTGRDALPDRQFMADLAASGDRVEELEAILDTATDGVVVIDKDGRVDNFNRSAEALFGVEARDVLGTPFTDLLAEESRKAALDYLDGLAANGVASVLNDGREVIGKVPKGGLIPLFMTMGRLSDGEKFCAVLRDITHWKNVEEELIAARRAAETANAQKSEFLAKISHEIRTPLNAIIGFSEVMMEERFGAISNDRYRAYLRDIHVSGAHLMSLINDLLDLSKIEAGKVELAFESVAINDIIQESVALMQPHANRERIIIRTSLSTEVPNVVADPRSLRQILLNLLSNAIKFTGAGGQVIVATALEDSGEVELRIRDTGVGMSEKDLETAMKAFRQVGANRGRGDGTGLGLPLTKALVEANRATFAINSAPNQGTLVKVTFPTTRVLAG